MNALAEAFRFLTAVPLPESKRGTSGLAGAVAWFPLVGAAMGGLFVLTDWLCGKVFPARSDLLSASLILAAYALFTGGLHHDGLMDMADAFWGGKGRSKERRLEIMKDSRVGALGVTALALLLLVEAASLFALPATVDGLAHFRWAALLVFPVLGRWVMAYMCVRFPYARSGGTGAVMVGQSRWAYLAAATLLAGGAASAVFVWMIRIPLLIPVMLLASWLIAEFAGQAAMRSIGGVTGDIIGATGILSEALLLLLLASRLPQLLVV